MFTIGSPPALTFLVPTPECREALNLQTGKGIPLHSVGASLDSSLQGLRGWLAEFRGDKVNESRENQFWFLVNKRFELQVVRVIEGLFASFDPCINYAEVQWFFIAGGGLDCRRVVVGVNK